MNETNELSITQKRAMKRAEFMRKFGKYWYIYMVLFGTAALSFTSGLLLPFKPDASGNPNITIGGLFAAIYYAVGFLTTGELAAYFWFDKLTDQDPDNGTQKVTAGLMLFAAVITSLVTALAAGTFIAYWLGIFNEFYVMPSWAQKWVVWAIPVLWVAHFVAGTIFRAVSEEAEYERDAKSIIRTVQNQMIRAKEQARSDYWKTNAPMLAQRMGEAEARDELAAYEAKIQERKRKQVGFTGFNHNDEPGNPPRRPPQE